MTDNPFDLTNETALITGGGTGIGLGIARCMARAGATVVLVGRREAELKRAVEAIGPRARQVAWDVTHVDRAAELLDRASGVAGAPVSVLVNNAGVHLKKPAVDTSPAEFNAVLQTHVVAAHALTSVALPGMIARKHGVVLFTASMVSFFGMPLVVAYAAAKSAHLGMVRSLSTEVAQHGVRVNAIAPGWIESDMLHKALSADADRKTRIEQRISAKRFGHPDDIGNAAVYLASPAVVSGNLQHLWVYLLAPTLGAALGVPVWRAVRPSARRAG
jgi:NAD(P)-dependent dehydrogenase (short-subunit alcohol dehydrogenase family)